MQSLAGWFPYAEFRPFQQEMLESAAKCVRERGILMIDAPTGSGKSSVVAALLSEARGKKIIIAVRTISQLNTFIRELELIRKKNRGLSFSYLIGKGSMCPLAREQNPYRLCEGVKHYTTALMRDRAGKGSLVPAKDPVIKDQIAHMAPERPLICPHYVQSRVFVHTPEGLSMAPSATLKARAEQASRKGMPPERLWEFAGRLCPYELMIQAARQSDVIILNFHHLFNEEIREQIYQSIGIVADDAILLIDEAHNAGDTIQNVRSVVLEERFLEQVRLELAGHRTRIAGVSEILPLIPRIEAFAESLKRSWKGEDWFDPALFIRHVLSGSPYRGCETLIEDLLTISESIRDHNVRRGDFAETATDRLLNFFYRVNLAISDSAYLSLYRRNGEEIDLEVRNIDPAPALQQLAGEHAASVFISGTLSPVESYRRYYFEDLNVTTLSLPNAFPPEHRLVLFARDITSAYRKRGEPANISRIREYIESFAGLRGNLAVYFPSYEMLSTFSESLPPILHGKEIFVEQGNAAVAAVALQQFLSLPERGRSGILMGVCGGKWSEGLDYRGDLLSGAMVIGLPLAPFSPVRKMTIEYFVKKFGEEGEFISYTLPALNRAMQALGRVLRTPEDRGVLVLGEARYLDPAIKTRLPAWLCKEGNPCTVAEFRDRVAAWR
ncbi:MAG: ATP-dependent DNA helicase [Methanomicrobiaceae archaeon]|nr:ATP-dependent DNA helicase [Methanomicrobiaceae archaeon]